MIDLLNKIFWFSVKDGSVLFLVVLVLVLLNEALN